MKREFDEAFVRQFIEDGYGPNTGRFDQDLKDFAIVVAKWQFDRDAIKIRNLELELAETKAKLNALASFIDDSEGQS